MSFKPVVRMADLAMNSTGSVIVVMQEYALVSTCSMQSKWSCLHAK